jgi:peptide-methionine (S)-S-oxide reductase
MSALKRYDTMRFFSLSINLLVGACFFTACANPENPNKSMNNLTSKTVGTNEESFAKKTDTATFGTGCFWCTEAVFQQLNGVLKVTSGYSGGHVVNPSYEQVCAKNTGHAEVIQIVFDAEKISFDELLEVFWQTHDPTTLNRQGNDEGPQYRSVVFYHNEMQKERTEFFKSRLETNKAFDRPIVTAIEPFKNFYAAENYHQNYYNLNGAQPYCTYVIRPKLEKFEKAFKDKLRKN